MTPSILSAERNPDLTPAARSRRITKNTTRTQRPRPQPQTTPETPTVLSSGTSSNESRMLFTSPSPSEAIEDSQNEGCNI